MRIRPISKLYNITVKNPIYNKFFTQIKGTVMGTRAAPNFANVYMGNFENKYIYQNAEMANIIFYKRFIDYIFFIWTGREQRLKELLDHLNKVHDSNSNTHSFLDKTSCHSIQTKNSIPYSQFTRIKIICSDGEDFRRRAKEHKTFFKAHGYTEK